MMAQVSEVNGAPLSPPARRWVPLAMAAGLLLPFAAALVLVPFRDRFANAAAALCVVAVIVGVAAFGDRWSGWLAAASGAAWFDFFLTKPYEAFSISAAHDIETTVALLVVGIAVTEIAVRSRRRFAVAVAEGNYLALIHDLSDLAAQGATPEQVAAAAREDLVLLFSLASCRFERLGSASGRPQLRRNGEVELGDVRFDVAHDGLPEREVDLPVQNHNRDYGVFVMSSGSQHPVTIEQRVVALVLADQVGAAFAGVASTRG